MKSAKLYFLLFVVAILQSCEIKKVYENYEPSELDAVKIVDKYFENLKSKNYDRLADDFRTLDTGIHQQEFLNFNFNYINKAGDLISYDIVAKTSKVTIYDGDTTGVVKIGVKAKHVNFDIDEDFNFKYVNSTLQFDNLMLYQTKLLEDVIKNPEDSSSAF